ncbi:MAG: cytochrome c [Pseudomonadales bacterium]|nr:cytochrome c [Pseudomonadales bacterium]
MRMLLKILGFSLTLILTFTAVTYVLPQMKGEAPIEKALDLGALTMDSFIALGEELYRGKGTCTLCHNNLGRAPDLLALNVEKVSLKRLADSRYQGSAKDVEGYIRESMVDPNIYVVAGFGKKGSNDTESPMPAIDQPPVQLSSVEIDAIVAFLQDKDGNTVTVTLPTTVPESTTVTPETLGLAQSPEEAIAKFACSACHSVLGTESAVGPNLNDIGDRLNSDQIRASIITPNAVIAEGYPPIMPDFSAKMMVAELEMIVYFLSKQKAIKANGTKPGEAKQTEAQP